MAVPGVGVFRWLRRLTRKLHPPRRVLSAQLIAPIGEFEDAVRLAEPSVARLLRAGRRSSSAADQIGAAVQARLTLAERMSTEELVRYVQHLQNRYRIAVSQTTYSRYLEGVPKTVFENRDALWAELKTLSYRLRLVYTISYIRDQHLALIRKWCFRFLMASFSFVIFAVGYQEWSSTSSALLNYLIVGVMGLGGALTSIARRANGVFVSSPLEDDPVIQASALEQGAASLFIAGLTGPVFALILLIIFLSGALSVGDLTPRFLHMLPPGAMRPADFRIFQYVFWLNDRFDAAKLLLWSFVSGFAEQIVPDVLDKFAKIPERKGRGAHARESGQV